METINAWTIEWILTMQEAPWLIAIMRLYSGLGTEEFFLLLMPALYWSINAPLGQRLAVVLVASASVNDLLKLVFHLPRPYWTDSRVVALAAEPNYGFPSGHAQTATAVWGYLASQAAPHRRKGAWVAALALILLVSVSRMYLGVHFPSDVLAGWLVGGALLAAYVRWQPRATAWLGRQSLGRQLMLALIVSVVYFAAAAGVLAAIADTPDPEAWARTAAAAAPEAPPIHPRQLTGTANAAGMLLGLGAGLACASRWARFDAGGTWPKRVARYMIGVLGILIFWRGLALVFPGGTEPLGLAFRWLRYALTVYWAIYLAPLVFLKTRLAEPAP